MSALTCIDFPVALALSTLLLSFAMSAINLLRNAAVKGHSHE